MIAAPNTRPSQRSQHPERPPRTSRIDSKASNESFAFACIELFGRLWMELESASADEDAIHSDTSVLSPGLRLETLRLELVLLLDACRSGRWREQLDVSQRLTLQSTLGDVFDSLNESSGADTRDAIQWAQNRLLGAVLEHCAAHSPQMMTENVA